MRYYLQNLPLCQYLWIYSVYLDADNLSILLVLEPEQQQVQRINDQCPTLGMLLSDDADVLLTC